MENNENFAIEVEFNCAVGIIFDFMRRGLLSTAEYDLVYARLQEKYKGAE